MWWIFFAFSYFVFYVVKLWEIFKGICGDRILSSCLLAIAHCRLCKSISVGFLLLFFSVSTFLDLKYFIICMFCKYCSWCNKKVRWNTLSNVPNIFKKSRDLLLSWLVVYLSEIDLFSTVWQLEMIFCVCFWFGCNFFKLKDEMAFDLVINYFSFLPFTQI